MTRDQINQRISWGVARSWKDPVVATKRLTRNMVTCNGAFYQSVNQAFLILGLNMGKHIKFRMRLKAEKTAVYVENGKQYNFEIL